MNSSHVASYRYIIVSAFRPSTVSCHCSEQAISPVLHAVSAQPPPCVTCREHVKDPEVIAKSAPVLEGFVTSNLLLSTA